MILIAITVISRLVLALRPEAKLASRTYLEDSYYAFNTAYHIAQGNGITADGIHLTNGIQPLIVALYVPFFAIAGEDKWLALRLIFILIAALEVASIMILALLLKRLSCVNEDEVVWWQTPWIIGPAMWTFLYPLIWHHTNGLETGLYALMILSAMYAYAGIRISKSEASIKSWIVLGILLGFTVLARIDAVFLVGGIGLAELLRRRIEAIPHLICMTLTALFVSSPWWLFNYMQFGSFMPISGQSQSQESVLLENVIRSSAVLTDIISTFFYLPYYLLPSILLPVWIAVIVSTVYHLAARIKLWRFLPERARVEFLAPLAIMGVCLMVYYIFFFGAPHFLPRYYHPIRLLWLLLVCLSLPIVGKSFQASFREHKKMFLTFAIPLLLLIVGFNANRYYTNFGMSEYSELYRAGKWAAEHPEKRIGMFQSGTATFVAPNVINLDGKVNPDAIRAIQTTGIGTYIKEQQLDYLIDEPNFIRRLVNEADMNGVSFQLVDSIGSLKLYQRTNN